MRAQIHVGTCIPGQAALKMLPGMLGKGFERYEICFHMDFYGVDLPALAPQVRELAQSDGAALASLGFYANPIAIPEHISMLEQCIDWAELFGVKIISTFAGAVPDKSVEEALPAFKRIYGELCKKAADKGVSIALENCPMGGTWQRNTCNIAYAPRAWEMLFNEVPADNLGLEWEPAHAMSQLIDPIVELKKWAPKVKHVHGKDGSCDWDGIRHEGIASGVNFVPNRFPGMGDTNWRDVFTILHRNGYEGDVCIEGYHDPLFGREWEMTSQLHALNYLKWARGGDYVENPWSIQ